jgi:hypothetical protein
MVKINNYAILEILTIIERLKTDEPKQVHSMSVKFQKEQHMVG